ncbi:MAG TPA: hypothetical protein VNT60_07850 [Deinococcales bacterium]|nr:hypothetical protein [Deinococcales bacterium]
MTATASPAPKGAQAKGSATSIAVPLMDATLDKKGVTAGLAVSGVLTLLVFVGSEGLKSFDGALAGYCFSALFATFGVVYRYAVWLQRPATRLYWRRGWALFWQPGKRLKNCWLFFGLMGEKMLAQRFILRRSRRRWLAHQLIFWGCLLAIAVTFPLSFGWVRFEGNVLDPSQYMAVLFGIRLEFFQFGARSLVGWIIFHLLDISAVLCLAGIGLSLGRRVRDEAEMVVQRVDNDFIPLFLLFAVSVTGLMLTVSNMFMAGKFYYWITTTHAVTVMLWLLFLPFGKFFHIFQRVANMGVWFYKAAGSESEQANCVRCGTAYTSVMHRDDIKSILPDVDFDYSLNGGGNWQDHCPSCRRKLVTLNQFRVTGKQFL